MAREMMVKITQGVRRQLIQENACELDYKKTYSPASLILLFFSLAFAGWLWEVVLHIFLDGALINRGTMFGPWLPIYGVGGVLTILLLQRLGDNPIRVFGAAYLGSGILEYTTGWALENFFGMKYWDYSQSLLDIRGRVCLEVLMMFAVGACVILYIAAPKLDELYNRIPDRIKVLLCICLLAAFAADLVYSFQNPNMGPGITQEIGTAVSQLK